jgi:patatin-related protein
VREKELRLALVFFGGISLAVYMHGISKEILKLVRASSALHAITDRATRLKASFFDRGDLNGPEYDTEGIYFELLREIGRKIDLRVIADVIAGASAGGINGVMLARALAHDLPMDGLRDLWLADADVDVLLSRESRARAWSKWFLVPFIWGAGRIRFLETIHDLEVRRKLSLFVRSRWFKPPFDGSRMSELMLSGLTVMGAPKTPTQSLLPTGMRLELFVTVTDFFGYQQLIQIHDPPLIEEREHRHILHFGYARTSSGAVESDFCLADTPALAFAARATSCFPGAFPPAQIVEIDRLLAIKDMAWPNRARFLERNFARYYQAGVDPEHTCFIDGSVLNNKPFNEAIQSVRGRPAYRQVDRRLIYVDPHPMQPPAALTGRLPGFFTALRGALSDIPRNEPIADELGWVNGFNDRVRRLKAIVDAARPDIARLIAGVTDAAIDQPATVDQVGAWREAVNVRVRENAGFAYEGYVRLKLTSARAFVARTIGILCAMAPRSLGARMAAEIVDAWACGNGILYGEGDSKALGREASAGAAAPPWVRFLLSFDVEYRMRRLSFLIQGQNKLYQGVGERGLSSESAQMADRLKRDFYHALDALKRCEHPEFFQAATREAARKLFAVRPKAAEAKNIEAFAQQFVEANGTALDALIRTLGAEIDLDRATRDLDALLAGMDHDGWTRAVRREVLTNYLGFPFWDVLTFSVTSWRDVGEFDEIRIDRLSPEDARTVGATPRFLELRGTRLGHFGAFFSRAYRENDYLLGRLHAADRLIDIVCDSAGIDRDNDPIGVPALKRRIFALILDAEAKHLPNIRDLIAELRRALVATEEGEGTTKTERHKEFA